MSSILGLTIYVPRDENFGHLKLSDFLGFALKSLASNVQPELVNLINLTPGEFDKFQDVHDLYEGGFPVPVDVFRNLTKGFTPPMFQELLRTESDQRFLKFSRPRVVKGNRDRESLDTTFFLFFFIR